MVLQLSWQTIAAAFLGHHISYNSWETGRENPSLSPVAEGSAQARHTGTVQTDASLLPFIHDSSTKTGTSEQHSPARTSRDNSGLLKARQVTTTCTHIKRSRASQPSQSQNSLFPAPLPLDISCLALCHLPTVPKLTVFLSQDPYPSIPLENHPQQRGFAEAKGIPPAKRSPAACISTYQYKSKQEITQCFEQVERQTSSLENLFSRNMQDLSNEEGSVERGMGQ